MASRYVSFLFLRKDCSAAKAKKSGQRLPAGVKKFGLTAGLPVNLLGLVGTDGKIWGLESFGFSAPYKVLDEKLGFTAENVYNQVKAMF